MEHDALPGEQPGEPQPRRHQVAWAVTIGLALSATLAGLLMPVVRPTRERRGPAQHCTANLKRLSVATWMYTEDHDLAAPPSHTWGDALIPYADYTDGERWFRCPAGDRGQAGYAYNSHIAPTSWKRLANPPRCPLLWDAAGAWNAVGDARSLVFRHHGCANICYVDGHVQAADPGKAAALSWQPEEQPRGAGEREGAEPR